MSGTTDERARLRANATDGRGVRRRQADAACCVRARQAEATGGRGGLQASTASTSRVVIFALGAVALVLCGLIAVCATTSCATVSSSTDDADAMQVSDAEDLTHTLAQADYTSKINVLYQNALGLYSGCEIVSLTMVLNSMGIDIDPYDITETYLEYADDNTLNLLYGYSSYGGYGNYGYEDFPPLDDRRDALGSTTDESNSYDESGSRQYDTATGTGDAQGTDTYTSSDTGTRQSRQEDSRSVAWADPGTDSSTSASSGTNANSTHTSTEELLQKIVSCYIGSPYYSGMAYPPAIANTANKILEDYGSTLVARDETGSSLSDLHRYLDAGYPVIVWVTLDYTDPQVSWTPFEQSDWLWYNNLHCVVLCGYDTEADTVTIADPLQGLIELPTGVFEYVYDECGQMVVTIS